MKGGKILELGCGSGYPVGSFLLKQGEKYMGIDLSPKQIQIAKNEFSNWKSSFKEAEMLSYLNFLDKNSLKGIISLFSIFHLPRIKHIELFDQILRVLKPKGVLLFNASPKSWEGVANWFNSRMYWSNFSYKFYLVALQEMGFELLDQYRDIKKFLGENEETWYLLFQKSSQ